MHDEITENLQTNLILGEDEQPQNVKTMFFLLGNASLLAFNIILNAFDIYEAITGDSHIGFNLNRSFNIPNAITALILCVFKPKKLIQVLLITFVLLAIDLAVLPILLLIPISNSALTISTEIGCALAGILSSIIFSNAFSIASQFGPDASTAVSSGNGCCGLVASVLRIITKAFFSNESNLKVSSAIYYWLATLIIFLTFIYLLVKFKDSSIASKINPPDDDIPVLSKATLDTIKVIWSQWIGEFLNYCITLMLFSGYLQQAPQPAYIGSWTPVLVNTIFTVFDWIGRYAPTYFVWPSQKFAAIPVLCRSLFFPIFMLSLQRVINIPEPHWTLAWDAVFAITNGYFGTVAMIWGTNHSGLDDTQKRFSGLLMSFAINAGILSAMFLTFVMPDPA